MFSSPLPLPPHRFPPLLRMRHVVPGPCQNPFLFPFFPRASALFLAPSLWPGPLPLFLFWTAFPPVSFRTPPLSIWSPSQVCSSLTPPSVFPPLPPFPSLRFFFFFFWSSFSFPFFGSDSTFRDPPPLFPSPCLRAARFFFCPLLLVRSTGSPLLISSLPSHALPFFCDCDGMRFSHRGSDFSPFLGTGEAPFPFMGVP